MRYKKNINFILTFILTLGLFFVSFGCDDGNNNRDSGLCDFQAGGGFSESQEKALQIEPGDVFFYYITGLQKLAAMVTVDSFVTEAADKIWVNLGKDPEEQYPWRFEISPHTILNQEAWLDMINFSKKLLHFRKWPEKNWRLGLQGQIHALREEDTITLLDAFNTAKTAPH